MKKFLLLYRAPISAKEQMAKSTPEQAKAGMDAWVNWAGKNKDMIIDLGTPLATTKTMTATSSMSGDETIAGFSIVQAESAEAVMEKLKDHPHYMMAEGSIEVLEYLPMPGM